MNIISRIKENPLNKANWINDKEEKDESPKTKKRPSNKKGLPKGWIRATFIVKEDLLNKLKDLAYDNRNTIKDELDNALEAYLKDKDPIERPE